MTDCLANTFIDCIINTVKDKKQNNRQCNFHGANVTNCISLKLIFLCNNKRKENEKNILSKLDFS